jgi:hypothetical protein
VEKEFGIVSEICTFVLVEGAAAVKAGDKVDGWLVVEESASTEPPP